MHLELIVAWQDRHWYGQPLDQNRHICILWLQCSVQLWWSLLSHPFARGHHRLPCPSKTNDPCYLVRKIWHVLFEKFVCISTVCTFHARTWFIGSAGFVSFLLVQSVRIFGRTLAGVSGSRGVLFVVGSILKEPYPFHPKLMSLRIMLGMFLLSSSVISYGYSGTLTSFLTISLPPEQLDKVTGLLPLLVVNLFCYFSFSKIDLVTLDAAPSARQNSLNMTKQFLRDPNPAYKPLAKKFHFYPSLGVGLEWMKEVFFIVWLRYRKLTLIWSFNCLEKNSHDWIPFQTWVLCTQVSSQKRRPAR